MAVAAIASALQNCSKSLRRCASSPVFPNSPHATFLRFSSPHVVGLRPTTTAAGCPFPKQAVPVKLKKFEAMPRPYGIPLLGTLFHVLANGGPAKYHEYTHRRFQELGLLYREKLGIVEAVFVADKHLVQRIYLAEGPHPRHLVPECWLIYNDRKNVHRGLFFMNGPQWLRRRKLLNQVLIAPQEVTKYGQAFGDVITDLVNRWRDMARSDPEAIIRNLENELYNWSIESLGTMVFGKRMGCVPPPGHPNPLSNFVQYVQQIFAESSRLSVIPPHFACVLGLPVWKRFEKAADEALYLARKYSEERRDEILSLQTAGHQVSGVMGRLLADGQVAHEEVVDIMSDLVLAAADTTSHATQWALHCLARHPRYQEELLRQINSVVPQGLPVKEYHIDKIPLSMWIVKETLRLYPIAPFLTRYLPQSIVLGDYEIPSNTLFVMSQYTMGRDPVEFPEPHRFLPERWQRSASKERSASACMPFGMGARSCIGRRVAELKMRLLIARVVQNFRLESANEREVDIAMRLITTPDRPIKIRFHERAS